MLSSIELILLSIISHKATHAYEINKEIQQKNMRDWVRIGVASVYQVLDRLEKKGLVVSQREKVGKMPERKKYQITQLGKELLRAGIKELIKTQENYYLNLNVGLECSDILNQEELAECLQMRLERLKTWLSQDKNLLLEKGTGHLQEQLVRENIVNFYRAEKIFLEKCLQELGRETAAN